MNKAALAHLDGAERLKDAALLSKQSLDERAAALRRRQSESMKNGVAECGMAQACSPESQAACCAAAAGSAAATATWLTASSCPRGRSIPSSGSIQRLAAD